MYNAALILEGGGMRGVFTAGVLDFFLDNRVAFSDVWGVSAGACHACSYLSGQRGRAYAVSTDYLGDRRYLSLWSLLTTGDIFGADLTYDIVPNQLNLYDYDAFAKNPARFIAVVTNCITGAAEYLPITDLRNDMIKIRASSSLPGVSKMVTIDGRLYLDGGVADPIPLRAARNAGLKRDVLILTQPLGYRKQPSVTVVADAKYLMYPLLRQAISQRYRVYNETLAYIRRLETRGEIFVIRPPHPLGLSRFEKDKLKLRTAYEDGYTTAARAFGRLQSYLAAKV